MTRPDLPRIKPTNHHPIEIRTSPETAPIWGWTFLLLILTLLGGALWIGVRVAHWLG
jgi:hypothetical protein